MRPEQQPGAFVPSYSYATQTRAPSLGSTLRGSCSWIVVPAVAMAVSLGVTLPTPARAQTALPSSTTTVDLTNYGGATNFTAAPTTVIGVSSGDAVDGDNTNIWTLANQGFITTSDDNKAGLNFQGGGSIDNSGNILATGVGSSDGVVIAGAPGTVTNSYLIAGGSGGSGTGIVFSAGGSVFNNGSAANITGYLNGIDISGGVGNVTNAGTISGSFGTGILFEDTGGTFNNTVINGGTIIGNTAAVQFGDGDDLLELEAGATFFGAVDGGGGTNTLEFLSGAVLTTPSFTNFQNLVVDSLASGGLTNDETFSTITNNGSLINNASLTVTTTFGNQGYFSNTYSLTNQGTINNGGTFINSGYLNTVGGTILDSGIFTNTNTGIISGTVTLTGAGTLSNAGTITGYTGVYSASDAARTLTNTGVITGYGASTTDGFGVGLMGGGSITNGDSATTSAYINGYRAGVFITGAAGSVTNWGTIRSFFGGHITHGIAGGLSGHAYGAGVYLGQGGTVSNKGAASYIYGGVGVAIYGAPGTVSNEGLIIGRATYGLGVALPKGGSVLNSGSIVAYGSYAIGIGIAGGTVTNSGTNSTIFGVYDGVRGTDAAVTVSNSGTIYGFSHDGVHLGAGGSVTNSGTASYIFGEQIGVKISGTGAVFNEGTIIGGCGCVGYGVELQSGIVTNSGSASYIYGAVDGVLFTHAGTVINQGTIYGYDVGVVLNQGGSITNSGTASVINGGDVGVRVLGGPGVIVNDGTIEDFFSKGIGLYQGGSITNTNSKALISGFVGIVSSGAAATVTNAGTIIGTDTVKGTAILFQDIGGTFNNTVANSGSIIGNNGTAVQFGAGNDLLQIESGASFTGVADGGAGTNTLEFVSGTAALSTLGTEYLEFQDIDVDAGATLNTDGVATIASNITISNAGTFTNSSSLTIDGSFGNTGLFINTGTISTPNGFSSSGTFQNSGLVTGGTNGINASGIVTNSGTIVGTAGIGVDFTGAGTLTNTGFIQGGQYGVRAGASGIVANSGTIVGTTGIGVDFTGAGTLTNTGFIKGGQYGVKVGAGGMVINSGTIVDAAVAGATLGSSAVLVNKTGATLYGVTGAVFTGTGASLTNNGTITGTGGIAVQFDAGVNTLTIDTGSVLNGGIDGGGGAGQIALTGSGTFSNAVTNFGAGSGLTIANGASWAATGNLAIASVTNAGTLTPGTLAAPLKLTGNFTQTSTGVLQVTLDSSGAGSQIQAGGTATLAGSVALTVPGTFTAGTRTYTIVNAAGGVSGTFSDVTGGSVLLIPSLSYDADDAFVTLTQADLALSPADETPNELAAATAFDTGRKADVAAFLPALTALDRYTVTADLKAAIDRISGENNADLSTSALWAGRQFINQVQLHDLLARPAADTWDVWFSGYTQSGDLDGDGNAHRFDQNGQGIAGGVSHSIGTSLRVGAAFGYGSAGFKIGGGNGHARIDYTQAAVTADYVGGPFYIDGLIGGAWGNGSTTRDVSLPGLPAVASAHVSDGQLLGALEAGYNIPFETVQISPFAALNVGSVDEDGFTEKGAGALNLDVAGKTTSGTQSVLGTRLTTNLPLGPATLNADFKLGWAHEFSTARTATQSFAGTPGTSFTIDGASLPGDSAVLGAGLSAAIFTGGSAYLHYDADISGSGSVHAFTAGFRFGW